MQLDHLTIVGCNTGILYGCHVLPVIKNSIIAGEYKHSGVARERMRRKIKEKISHTPPVWNSKR